MSLRLIIEDDEGATTIVPLGADAITIGRQQGNTIQLTEKNVSRRHARLVPDSGNWWIEDLGSYNGVKVNQSAVEGRVRLQDGDVVQIGDYHLALTADADRRSLNYERPVPAANDGEPMLASSSSDLPRLSPDEIHALQSSSPSGPQPVIVDSGPVPVTQYPAGYPEEEKRGNAGMIVGGGLVLIGALALGAFFVAGSGGDDEVSAKAPSPPAPVERIKPGEDKGAAAVPDAPDPPEDTPPQDRIQVEAPNDAPPPPTDAAPPPTPPADAAPPPTPTPPKPAGKKPGKRPKKPGKRPSKPDPAPAAAPPGPSAKELLQQARAAVFSNASAAYQLAKQSYDLKRTPDALFIMGQAACRSNQKAKAKKAHAKLKGTHRATVEKICLSKGIEL